MYHTSSQVNSLIKGLAGGDLDACTGLLNAEDIPLEPLVSKEAYGCITMQSPLFKDTVPDCIPDGLLVLDRPGCWSILSLTERDRSPRPT